MRILFVLHDFLPAHQAGTEIYTFEVARELLLRGHEVHVFATEKDIGRENLTVRRREYEGLVVHELTNNLFYDEFPETWDYPPAVEPLARLLDELQPDVVHFMHLLYLSVGCVEEVARRGIPVFYHLHDYWLQCARWGQRIHVNGSICHDIVPEVCGECLLDLKFKQTRIERATARGIARLKSSTGLDLGGPARRLGDLVKGRGKAGKAPQPAEPATTEARAADPEAVRSMAELVRRRESVLRDRLLPFVDRFLAPSNFLRDRFIEWGIPEQQIDFCRTGIQLAPFEGLERVPVPEGAALRVAFIGTPAPHKGVHVLLEAWRRLDPALRARGELRVFGPLDHNPGYIRELQLIAAQCGASLPGRLARRDVATTLARTDLLVVPSIWYENSPLTILEAQATRTPVAVSDLGGMAELVEPGKSGFRFRVGDADDLSGLLARLLEDKSELDELFAADVAVKSSDTDAREFEELYLEVLGAKATASSES